MTDSARHIYGARGLARRARPRPTRSERRSGSTRHGPRATGRRAQSKGRGLDSHPHAGTFHDLRGGGGGRIGQQSSPSLCSVLATERDEGRGREGRGAWGCSSSC